MSYMTLMVPPYLIWNRYLMVPLYLIWDMYLMVPPHVCMVSPYLIWNRYLMVPPYLIRNRYHMVPPHVQYDFFRPARMVPPNMLDMIFPGRLRKSPLRDLTIAEIQRCVQRTSHTHPLKCTYFDLLKS